MKSSRKDISENIATAIYKVIAEKGIGKKLKKVIQKSAKKIAKRAEKAGFFSQEKGVKHSL